MKRQVVVLRYGHRIVRDYRVTSHCAMVARAFGAEKIIICGAEDKELIQSVKKISDKWGKGFKAGFTDSWRKEFKKFKKQGFEIVHLTMYGLPLTKKIKEIQKKKNLLLVIGSQKVEKEVYNLADVNVSITMQPHSEISALAVFLDRYFEGKFIEKRFSNSKIQIEPQDKGKGVLRHTE